jgi:hypothetical protein
MPDDTPRPWHRLFGITLTDLIAGTPWRVELEKELALRQRSRHQQRDAMAKHGNPPSDGAAA